MNRTKQIGIITVLVLLIGAFVLVPLLKPTAPELDNQTGAEFTFPENLAASYGQKVPISFTLKEGEIKKVELFFQDSLLHSWASPKAKTDFTFDTEAFGIGSKEVNLVTTFENGEEFVDSRIIRILSDVSPNQLKAEVLDKYIHNSTSFTQGLEFNEGVLFESTGQKGQSKIARVTLESGATTTENKLDANYFGEGITIFGDKIYQLTWQEQKCFVYDKKTLQIQPKDFTYTGEGWGLCNNGKSLIMSNGTEYITFRNPETFQVEKTIEVYDQVGPRTSLNELEYINGLIYANIWMLDIILVIDPNNGKVLSEIDCSEVVKAGKGSGEVLNGIAYNPKNGKTYLTGKNWAYLLEVSFK